MKRPPAVPCRGTERLLDHDTSLPTDSDDGQCLCEQRQHTPVTSGDTTLSECRSLASLPKRCCRPSPSLPHNQSIPSPLHNRHRAISGNVTGLVLVGCLLRLRRSVVFEHRRSRLELRWIVEANDQSGLRGSELNAWGDTHGVRVARRHTRHDHSESGTGRSRSDRPHSQRAEDG